MEDAPRHRVAHAHGVLFAGPQWERYLQFRDLLRRSETARRACENAKQLLAVKHPEGRWSYSLGKTTTVLSLLGEMRGAGTAKATTQPATRV